MIYFILYCVLSYTLLCGHTFITEGKLTLADCITHLMAAPLGVFILVLVAIFSFNDFVDRSRRIVLFKRK